MSHFFPVAETPKREIEHTQQQRVQKVLRESETELSPQIQEN